MTTYRMSIVEFTELRELDGDWTAADYLKLLKRLELDGPEGMSEVEVREMCLLGLQDLDPAEAAEVVLAYKFEGNLTDGQIKNFSNEFQFEKLWEHGGDMELHRTMFSVGSLLSAVNEQLFPTPDAVRVTMEVECKDAESAKLLQDDTAPQLIVRMLSAGMDDDAVLKRLFADELQSGNFPDAASLIWDLDVEHPTAITAIVKVTSSGYWLDSLKETTAFTWEGHSQTT